MHPLAPTLAAAALFVAPLHAQPATPPTWDTVDRFIAAEIEKGFAGSVLLVRDGEIVLHEGYGLADREAGVQNTPETIFALGSTPIDFTLVSILQLLHAGKLSLDDSVAEYFDMPTDKRPITLHHLMTGASGLPDFIDRPGDADPDHTYISRDEFVQRIREADLLFEPGGGDEHSHAAWCLLAAVVEVAGGTTYPEYVRTNVLEPAGMTRTGFYGEQFPGETVAIGYGPRTWGETNSPPHWGETSWLVMGSGGMVGSTGDLRRFHEAIDDGTLVPDAVREHYPSRGLYANGDMYGFETMYNYGGDDLFYINCNSSDPMNGYNLESFGRAMHALCTNAPVSRFSIGLAIDNQDGRLVVARVPSGSPAAEAGLMPGDMLLAANGTPFDAEQPLEALRPSIERGVPLELRIERAGETRIITITPRSREP